MQMTPAQQAEHDFLKRVIRRLQDEKNRPDAYKNIDIELFVAREEFHQFVSILRKQGVEI
jgi:hypothetical protein